MNMLEQLARLVLPKEILDNFDIVKIETDESDIDSMSMTIYLDQGGRIKMRSPPKVLTGNFRPSQLSFFLS